MGSPEFKERVKQYAIARGLILEEEPLGYGTDGSVWGANRNSAVKVFALEKNYDRELRCYQRLTEHRVEEIDGLTVPKLIDFDGELLIVEIEIVEPPYLLDFGKAYIDEPSPFTQEELAIYRASLARHFRKIDLPRINKICGMLRVFGIEYLDAKPANIRLRSDREEAEMPDDDDDSDEELLMDENDP